MYNWQHKGGLDSRVLTQVDYTKISDPYYFQDLQHRPDRREKRRLREPARFRDLPRRQLAKPPLA